MKYLYLVRHCKSESQHPGAPLTLEGRAQAEALADFFMDKKIERVVSSPYARAQQSIEPFARRLGLKIELDEHLVEHRLSAKDLPDWMDKLRQSFDDLEVVFEGGESSRAAMERSVSSISDILRHEARSTLIVTHGKLMTLLLKHFDDRFGFEDWEKLTNPDVFLVKIEGRFPRSVERLWE
ncbi:histidine phosphatase family protein [Candidatus Acetothermia bacterium]|nr:histidine phosphatase family protein [Candidatus Acetothermia bacterium]